jgi:alanine-synthesizing transaminase
MMRFSTVASRFQSPRNSLYRERDLLLARGEQVIDLVSGNLNRHGIFFPQEVLEEIVTEAARRSRAYRPHPLGQRVAREAIRGYYLKNQLDVPVDRIILTPGTSLSYWYCFKLLADPGDEILSPIPSYPLFDHIAELSGARMVPYPLEEAHGWSIDLDHLERAITPRTRAIIVISPHNPTGRVTSVEEIERLAEIASRHDLAILSDEVFSEFLFGPELSSSQPSAPDPSTSIPYPRLPRAAAAGAPLVFTLNGFSKMFALPGMKIGWMALSGEAERVRRAIEALETFSDAFLPVGEIPQQAVAEIFRRGEAFLSGYVAEIRARFGVAREILSRSPAIRFTPPQGGFYLCARMVDPKADEESLAIALLKEARILLHPGYFYDLDPPHLVVSIVPEPEVLAPALEKVVKKLEGKSAV